MNKKGEDNVGSPNSEEEFLISSPPPLGTKDLFSTKCERLTPGNRESLEDFIALMKSI